MPPRRASARLVAVIAGALLALPLLGGCFTVPTFPLTEGTEYATEEVDSSAVHDDLRAAMDGAVGTSVSTGDDEGIMCLFVSLDLSTDAPTAAEVEALLSAIARHLPPEFDSVDFLVDGPSGGIDLAPPLTELGIGSDPSRYEIRNGNLFITDTEDFVARFG